MIYWEKDENIPKHESLTALAKLLDTSTDWLLTGKESNSFKPLSFDNFYEAFTLPMFLPMLFIPGYLKAQSEPVNSLASSKGFQLSIIGFGLVLLIAFCFTMGKGMRF